MEQTLRNSRGPSVTANHESASAPARGETPGDRVEPQRCGVIGDDGSKQEPSPNTALHPQSSLHGKRLRQWTDQERIAAVKEIFNTITPRYDLLNRIMSCRQDVRWRRFAVTLIPRDASKVLDLATGTGDLAIELAESRPAATVFAADFVETMMRVAQEKTRSKQLQHRINYAAGDAMALPFADGEFDALTIGFGLRNIPDRLSALKEMKRVVRSGGKVITLEMTFPRNLRLRKLFAWYLNHIIPVVGGIISGNPAAYRYLPDSIQGFLHPDDLSRLFREVGLQSVKAHPLMFGLTYVHEGTVP